MNLNKRTKRDIAIEVVLAILVILLLVMMALPGDWTLGALLNWWKS